VLESVCWICGCEIDHCDSSIHVGEGIVCEECWESPAIRYALLCDLEDTQAPLCWICSGQLDHRHASVHVGGWVVCLRCYREYTSGRLFGDHDDYNWLMSQNREAEVFAMALRQAHEDWLSREVALLEFERGEP